MTHNVESHWLKKKKKKKKERKKKSMLPQTKTPKHNKASY